MTKFDRKSFPDEFILISDNLIADDISSILKEDNYAIVIAKDRSDFFKIIKDNSPLAVLLSVDIVKNNLESVNIIPQNLPLIVITDYSEIDFILSALKNKNIDIITNPIHPKLLMRKLNRFFDGVKNDKENLVASKLASLHEIGNKLASTHDLSKILDMTINFSIDIFDAQKGSVLLVDKSMKELVIVRSKGIKEENIKSSLANKDEWPVLKWVVAHKESMLVNDGSTYPHVDGLYCEQIESKSVISVPLKVGDIVLGVMIIGRDDKTNLFTVTDQKTAEVFASEVSIAINNAILYSSVKQKLNELSFIGNFSEKLTGVLDVGDVAGHLFDAVRRHFKVDIIGFMVVKKRMHDFLYWSPVNVDDNLINQICADTVDEYNNVSDSKISVKRVVPHILGNTQLKNDKIYGPLNFQYITPIVVDGYGFGAVFVGSVRDFKDKENNISLLSSLVNQTRIALANAKLYNDMKENYIRTIKALAIAVDAKDTYTHGHSENVMKIAEAIAIEMDLDNEMIRTIRDAGLLHDIGKIGIPGEILRKPEPLTEEEYNGVMKTHSTMGANIVKDVPFLKELSTLILHHHERYDGGGYPDGLAKNDIPLGARILHVADSYEAMTSDRPYRNSLGQREAIKRLTKEKGKQFDPGIVDVFINLVRKKGWI